jgi:hypothetical protein
MAVIVDIAVIVVVVLNIAAAAHAANIPRICTLAAIDLAVNNLYPQDTRLPFEPYQVFQKN